MRLRMVTHFKGLGFGWERQSTIALVNPVFLMGQHFGPISAHPARFEACSSFSGTSPTNQNNAVLMAVASQRGTTPSLWGPRLPAGAELIELRKFRQ